MRSYRETMEDLRFSPEEKAAMTQALLQAAPQAKPRKRKKAALIAVAAAAAALCAACATGALQDAIVALSTRFGAEPAQVETLQKITRTVLAKDTDNGVTLSVVSLSGDPKRGGYLLCRMEREDGQPVLPQNEDTKNVSNGDNTLLFERSSLFFRSPADSKGTLTPYTEATLSQEFLDFSVDDHALYFFVDMFTFAESFPQGEMVLTLENLYSHEFYYTTTPSSLMDGAPPVDRTIPLIDGTWTITFSPDWAGTSFAVGSGQVFHTETKNHCPLEGTISSFRLSPLSLFLDYTYTVDPKDLENLKKSYDPSEGLSLDDWVSLELAEGLFFVHNDFYVTLSDGTKIDFASQGGTYGSYESGSSRYAFSIQFVNVLPLDNAVSVTIGDVTLPLPKQ